MDDKKPDWFKKHEEEDKLRFTKLDDAIEKLGDKLEAKLDNLKDNHFAHLQADIVSIKVRMAYYIGGATAIVWVLDKLLQFQK